MRLMAMFRLAFKYFASTGFVAVQKLELLFTRAHSKERHLPAIFASAMKVKACCDVRDVMLSGTN